VRLRATIAFCAAGVRERVSASYSGSTVVAVAVATDAVDDGPAVAPRDFARRAMVREVLWWGLVLPSLSPSLSLP
jgi:hypothetical protein